MVPSHPDSVQPLQNIRCFIHELPSCGPGLCIAALYSILSTLSTICLITSSESLAYSRSRVLRSEGGFIINCVHLVSHCVWKAEDKAFTLPSGELGSIVWRQIRTVSLSAKIENQNSHIPHTYSQASCTFAARNRDYPVVYVYEVHAREVYAYEGFCEGLARQITVAHLSQLQLRFRRRHIRVSTLSHTGFSDHRGVLKATI
jgi:hypothetical protein